MEILRDLAQTLALDLSFFYHIVLAFLLFFVSKKWLFQPYIASMNQRRDFTKGRMEKSGDLDLQIQNSRVLYDQKAKKIHKEFQELFNKVREESLTQFSEESLKLEQEQKLWLQRERLKMKESAEEQNKILAKEIPQLKSALLNKVKS